MFFLHSNLSGTWGPVLTQLPAYFSGLRITVEVSVIGFAVALVLGILGAAARRSTNRVARIVASTYVEIFRNTPLLLQIFVAYFGLPSIGLPLSGFQAGIAALALNAGAYLTEVIRGGISSVPAGQYDAARVLSLGNFDTFVRIVLPQALRNVYPPIINQFIQVVLGSSLLSAIAVGDLTGAAETVNSQTLLTMQAFAVALVLYLVVSNAISFLAQGFALLVFHPPLETTGAIRRNGGLARLGRGMRMGSSSGDDAARKSAS